MKHLLLTDPLESVQPATDSSIALMKEAGNEGDGVEACEPDALGIAGGRAIATWFRSV